MTTEEAKTFVGSWKCRMRYPGHDDEKAEETTKNDMTSQVDKEGAIVFTSQPNQDGSYLVLRLTIDDSVATGRWHETTSPAGKYTGAMYSGAGQLLVSDDQKHLEGVWAGAGYDRDAKQLRMYTGHWELTRTA